MLPIVSALACRYLMLDLSVGTRIRLVIWLAIGLAVHAAYGYRHSRLRRAGGRPAEGVGDPG